MEFQAKRLGGLEVDHELELGGLQNRQVTGLLALENAPDVEPGLAVGVGLAGAVAYQAPGIGKLARGVDRRNCMASRQATRDSRCELRNAPVPTSSAPAPR